MLSTERLHHQRLHPKHVAWWWPGFCRGKGRQAKGMTSRCIRMTWHDIPSWQWKVGWISQISQKPPQKETTKNNCHRAIAFLGVLYCTLPLIIMEVENGSLQYDSFLSLRLNLHWTMIMGERVILFHHFDQRGILPKKEQVTELFQNWRPTTWR